METKMLRDLCTVLETFEGVIRHANFQSIDVVAIWTVNFP